MHRKTVHKQWEKLRAGSAAAVDAPRALELLSGGLGSDDERATLSSKELRAEEDAQFEAASAATLGPLTGSTAEQLFAREQQLLDQMTEIAEQARDRPDARTVRLIEWIRTHLCPDLGQPGAAWNDVRVLIFTEYDDTRRYLQRRLEAALEGSDQAAARIQVFHGPTPTAKREETSRRSTPIRASTPSASSSPQTPPAKGSTCRPSATTCSISTSPGIPAAWSSATAASTASFSLATKSSATTSSTSSVPRTASWKPSSARPRRSSRSYGLTSQIRRAASSIPVNIAEGYARGRREYQQFVKIAQRSLMELETHLMIAQRVELLPAPRLQHLMESTEQLGKMLNVLQQRLRD